MEPLGRPLPSLRRRFGQAGGTGPYLQLARWGLESSDQHFSNILADFVASTSNSLLEPNESDIRRAVESAVDRGIARHPADFADKAGLAKSTLHHVVYHRNRPSLAVALRVAAAADVSMAGLFIPEKWAVGISGRAPKALESAPRLRNPRKHDWAQIRRYAQVALDRGEAVSIRRLAQELEIDEAQCGTNIGELRTTLLQRGREVRQAQWERKLEALIEEVMEARRSLMEQNKRLTARAIGKEVGRPVGSPFMRHALRETKGMM